MAPPRIRQPLQRLDYQYYSGENREPLETLVKAFRAIQALPYDDPKSYFALSAWHGEPFRGPGRMDQSWWGGYCNHGNVLFPTWHRTLLLKLENSLREVDGGKYKDVTVPYWDELADTAYPDDPQGNIPDQPLEPPSPRILPRVLLEPKFILHSENGIEIDNPLYSYKLPRTLAGILTPEEVSTGQANDDPVLKRYRKYKDYQTVRFPLSGLVGTSEARDNTSKINAQYVYPKNIDILNENVKNWLDGTVHITNPDDDTSKDTTIAVTTSVRHRLWASLQAPNYTLFSNTTSQKQYYTDNPDTDPWYLVPLESGHNGMHLALGGVYLPGKSGYNADDDRYRGANGDMGCNETASFDPIFYMHHCFIDYMFWKWQQSHGQTKRGSLDIIEGYDGTIVTDPVVGYAPGSVLNMNSPLYPFKKPDGAYYTSDDVTDINDLGYDYAPGSVDAKWELEGPGGSRGGNLHELPEGEKMESLIQVSNINRSQYRGSFVIKTYAKPPGWDMWFLIGAEPILSRWNVEGCANCQSKLEVHSIAAVNQDMLKNWNAEGRTKEIQYYVAIRTFDQEHTYRPDVSDAPTFGRPRGPGVGDDDNLEVPGPGDGRRVPIIRDLLGDQRSAA